MRREGSSSLPREPKPNFLFEACSAGTTSRVVANSSPRQTYERRVLHEGASFAFCAAFSRGGPGRLGLWCLGVLTTGSPGSPRWPTGWAESLSGSLAEQGVGLRVGRSRWSGHYPKSEASGSAPLVRSRTGAAFGSARMAPAYPVPAPAGFGHDRVQASRCGDSECSSKGR